MKQKTFDCIKMKREIHQKMLKELQGMSLEERLADFEKKIESNPILAEVWRRARKTAETQVR